MSRSRPSGGSPGNRNAKEPSPSWFKKTCKDVPVQSTNKPPEGKIAHAGQHLEYDPTLMKAPAVFISQDNLWNGTPQTIGYSFMGGTREQHDKVSSVIGEWSWYANVDFNQDTSRDGGTVRISFDPNDGSWSYVGRQIERVARDQATMNLAWLDPSSPRASTNERAVILHEFGHVLGLLHEHQSPAHGKYAVMNREATLELYRRTQGWSDEEIEAQVINVYKTSDVSNFSQVDTTSIMHYPMPKELTGLDEDILYNERLSDLDKAYMIIQYPRLQLGSEAVREGWSFEKALKVMGTPPDITKRVLDRIRLDRDQFSGEISPSNIRRIIEDWSRATRVKAGGGNQDPPHTVEPPSHDTEPLPGTPARAINTETQGLVIAAGIIDGEDLCGDPEPDELAPPGPGGKPAHAVTNQTALWPLPADKVTDTVKISYYLKVNPAGIESTEPSPYQKALFANAIKTWSDVAGVVFTPVADGARPDLVVYFHNPTQGPYEGSTRSWTRPKTGTERVALRTGPNDRDTRKPDIKYHSIFIEETAAKTWVSTKYAGKHGFELNQRTVIHELGHWLGLKHEESGIYGFYMYEFNKGPEKKRKQQKAITAGTFFATRYDAGSLMDAIGQRLNEDVLRILKTKGLQEASVGSMKGNGMSNVIIALGLSAYDRANIAFLYPSTTNLVIATADPNVFALKPLNAGTTKTVVEDYLTALQLFTDDSMKAISTPLRAGQWTKARQAYLDVLEQKQKAESGDRDLWDKFVGENLVVTTEEDSSNPAKKLKVTVELKPDDGKDDSKPAHGINDPAGGGAATPPAGDGSFVRLLYQKLSELYCPGGGQYFALQFPTRFLDKQSYAYALDGYFSRFNKPVTVNEAEFALTDALYPVAPIVGGPNGQTLSSNYSKALNSLIPTFESVEVRKQREKMRQWLLKETKAGNAAYTVDTRLAIPGITADTAKELSRATDMTITVGPSSTAPIEDQTAAKEMALQAIEGVMNSRMNYPRGMTRIEFADSLMQTYLSERKAWELERDMMVQKATEKLGGDSRALETVTRQLAHITALEEAKLSSKYTDAVVRGYSHTVRGFMGHLDIKSVAESLQDAKDSFRESALSSLYTASKVYPVAMLPADWFEALDTGFTREDLSQDPELIKAAVQAKAQLIDNLETQVANLRSFNKGDPEVAKAAVEAAAAKHEEALTALSKKYTESTISAVKLAVQAVQAALPGGPLATLATRGVTEILSKPSTDPTKAALLGMPGINEQALRDIGTQMDAVTEANVAVNSASRALTQQMSDYSLAVAGDTRTMVESIQRQLTTAKRELAELQESYTISRRSYAPAPAEGDTTQGNEQMGKMPAGNGGSRWSEIHISSSAKDTFSSTSSVASSSVSSSRCNFWIGSHSSSSATSEAQNQAEASAKTLDVEVSMRVTYVTVDRAGWFDPSLFEMSKAFMRGTKDDKYVSWSTWSVNDKTPDAAAEGIRANSTDKPSGYLAAFPVGYIMVKDCSIKVTSSSMSSSDMKKHFDTQSESSGGFLCFSHSNASRSSNDSSSSSTIETSNGVVVRIPGPQILGYMMQLTGKDESQPFKEEKVEDMFLEDPDADPAKPVPAPVGPAHGVGPGNSAPPEAKPKRQAGLRKYDEASTSEKPTETSDPAPPLKKPEHAVGGVVPEQHLSDLSSLTQEKKDEILMAVLSLLKK